MCMSCGCNIPYDDHGDDRNITLDDLRNAMYAGDVKSPKAVIKNMKQTFQDYEDGKIDNLFGDPKLPKDDDDDDDEPRAAMGIPISGGY